MKYCTHCGCEVVDDASVCPKCGSELSVPSTYKKSKSSYSALMAEKTDLPLQALCAHSLFHY